MKWLIALRLISCLVILEGIAMSFCTLAGLWMKDPPETLWKMLFCGFAAIFAGGMGIFFCRRKDNPQPGLREGFATVGGAWILCSLFGALPYIVVSNFGIADAFFETASGFTTTGATIVDSSLTLRNGATLPNGIESLPAVILFWRSFTQWVGGAGIVVFTLAILPFFGIGAQSLYNAEVPGVKNNLDQFTPRVATTARIIFWTYFVMTASLVLLLVMGGMHLFDAVCHAFTAVSTGGFSTKNASIGAFPSPYIQWVLILFMFLAGCNFLLLYRLFNGMSLKKYFTEEHKVFAGMLLSITLLITFFLMFHGVGKPGDLPKYLPFEEALRQAAFQVVSLVTTTGYCTADYTLYPAPCAPFILLLLFMGGCGGSTAGGFKCVRLVVLWKMATGEIKKSIFPRSLNLLKLDGKKMEIPALQKTIVFFIIFMASLVFFTLALPLVCEMDLVTALSSSMTALSNVGPGFGKVGPSCTFSWMNTPAKLLLALEMIIGRLELTTILVLFLPSFWKR